MGGSVSVLYAIAGVSMLALTAVAVSAISCLSVPGTTCTVDLRLAGGLALVFGVALAVVWFGRVTAGREFR